MPDQSSHESRSQALADEIRRFLVTAHTGGIAAIVVLAASLADKNIQPKWAVAPIVLFLLGILLAALSMFLAQHREIKRRDAEARGDPSPKFKVLLWSWVWNWLSLGLFALASIIGLCSLMRLPLLASAGA